MKEGKLSNELLEATILSRLAHDRDDILIGPGIGEDCAAIAFGDLACVLTTDPITGATKDIGKIAVHISCNDIASSGLTPIALLTTLLLPLDANEDDARVIMAQAHQTAGEMNVAIIGGHTEYTSAVVRPVVSVTAIGKGPKDKLAATAGAQPGDVIVMSKWAGLEGTAIISNEKTQELLTMGLQESELEKGIALLDHLSVVPEGKLGAAYNVHAMHDVTEGGIYGAIWEMCTASKLGAVVVEAAIPMLEETVKICKAYDLDPFRLISSGCMLMAMDEKDYQLCRTQAEKEGILLTEIGRITKGIEIQIDRGNETIPMTAPDVDELFKVFQ